VPLIASGGLEWLGNSVQCRKQSFSLTIIVTIINIIIIKNVLIAVTLLCVCVYLWTYLQHYLPYILAYKPTPIPTAENVAKISDSHISR